MQALMQNKGQKRWLKAMCTYKRVCTAYQPHGPRFTTPAQKIMCTLVRANVGRSRGSLQSSIRTRQGAKPTAQAAWESKACL